MKQKELTIYDDFNLKKTLSSFGSNTKIFQHWKGNMVKWHFVLN